MQANLDQIIQNEMSGLKAELEKARGNIPDFRKRAFNGIKENALVYCLERAADLSDGSLKTGGVDLSASANILARGLLECLFWVAWIMSSDENAKLFEYRARTDLIRALKQVLASGFGPGAVRKTPREVTQEILASAKAGTPPKKMGIKKIAKEAGLERVYLEYYGYLAAESHGGLYGIRSAGDKKYNIVASLAISKTVMACINTIVSNWISARKRTSMSDIRKILSIQ